MTNTNIIPDIHCQACGNIFTQEEKWELDEDPDWQGYSDCCNERIILEGECDVDEENSDCWHNE